MEKYTTVINMLEQLRLDSFIDKDLDTLNKHIEKVYDKDINVYSLYLDFIEYTRSLINEMLIYYYNNEEPIYIYRFDRIVYNYIFFLKYYDNKDEYVDNCRASFSDSFFIFISLVYEANETILMRNIKLEKIFEVK